VQTLLQWDSNEYYRLGWENLVGIENLDRKNTIILGWITKGDRKKLDIFEREVKNSRPSIRKLKRKLEDTN
jgi:hypothetical protein